MKLTDNRLPAPEWLRVAMALLERRSEPSVLMDRTARVVAANAVFGDMMGVPSDALAGRPWADACGADADAVQGRLERAGAADVTSDEWVVRTAGGFALRLSVQIAPIPETPAILVSVVRWCVAEGQAPAVGTRSYEVRVRPFGALVWAQSTDGAPVALGQPCFTALHQRVAPCPDCPAGAALRPGQTRVGVIVSGRGEPEIISAQSVSKDTLRLTARRVDDGLFAELVEAKLVEHAGRAALTQRELEVLHLLTLGRAPADVARALGFSVSTAKFHVQNVLRKLGAESRVDLLRVLVHGHGRGRPEPSEGPASELRRSVVQPAGTASRARRGGRRGRS